MMRFSSKIRRFSHRNGRRAGLLVLAIAIAVGCSSVPTGPMSSGAPSGGNEDPDLPDPSAAALGPPGVAPPGQSGGNIALPVYTQVPHPEGNDIADIRALFRDRTAPSAASQKDCDADFKRLKSLTQSAAETKEGVREMVLRDPVTYHWCFYSKVIALEDTLSSQTYLDDRQKKVLETYEFLIPVARGFMAEFHDSRYYRWAAYRYRQISETVFFRKLELAPESTQELVDVSNPFAGWRDTATAQSQADARGPFRVLEKYRLMHTNEAPVMPGSAAALGGVVPSFGAPLSAPGAGVVADSPVVDAASGAVLNAAPAAGAPPVTGARGLVGVIPAVGTPGSLGPAVAAPGATLGTAAPNAPAAGDAKVLNSLLPPPLDAHQVEVPQGAVGMPLAPQVLGTPPAVSRAPAANTYPAVSPPTSPARAPASLDPRPASNFGEAIPVVGMPPAVAAPAPVPVSPNMSTPLIVPPSREINPPVILSPPVSDPGIPPL